MAPLIGFPPRMLVSTVLAVFAETSLKMSKKKKEIHV